MVLLNIQSYHSVAASNSHKSDMFSGIDKIPEKLSCVGVFRRPARALVGKVVKVNDFSFHAGTSTFGNCVRSAMILKVNAAGAGLNSAILFWDDD